MSATQHFSPPPSTAIPTRTTGSGFSLNLTAFSTRFSQTISRSWGSAATMGSAGWISVVSPNFRSG